MGVGLKIAKYKAIVKDLDGKSYSPYPITEEEYAKLKLARAGNKPFVWIHDIEDNKVREINPREIKQFIPITNASESSYSVSRRWICNFGRRHPLHMQGACECAKEQFISSYTYWDRLRDMGFKINYASDITQEMIDRYDSEFGKRDLNET